MALRALFRKPRREVRGAAGIEALVQDVRYGLRMLRRSPGFTAVAALSLALGIGANSLIFTFVSAFLLRPLPFDRPERLLTLAEAFDRGTGSPVAYPNFLDWRQSGVFEGLAARRGADFTLSGAEGAERIPGAQVSAGFFALLGWKPLLGREFLPEEDRPGGDPVVLLAHSLWHSHFAADPAVVGKALTLNGRSYSVVGVLPPGFRLYRQAELFVPIGPSAGGDRRDTHVSIYLLGRMKPGATLEQVRAQMDTVARRLEQQYPETNTGHRITVTPLDEAVTWNQRPVLVMLLAAVGLVLLIACANISNLLLARALGREKEIAVRTALGASRSRVVRQLLTESLLLALAGGGLALILSGWGSHVLAASMANPDDLPVAGIRTDWRVLGVTALVSVLTGLGVGLAPALEVSRPNLNESLKEGRRAGIIGGGRRRFRSLLVASEVALAFVLVTGAGLLMRSLYHLIAGEMGFNPRNVLTLQLTGTRLASRAQRVEFRRQLVEEVRSLPGVQSVATASPLPLEGSTSISSFYLEGRPIPVRGEFPNCHMRYVRPEYFRAMGIRLLKGRGGIDSDDEPSPPVAVINETMARKYWPHDNPLGQRFREGMPNQNRPWRTVVGIVADTKEYGFKTPERLDVYVPYFELADLVVRTASDPLALAPAVRRRIQNLDKNLAVYDIKTMEQRLSEWLSTQRGAAILLGAFATLALALAMVGIYGVVAHSASQRRQEVGIRLALGARPGDVSRLVLREGMWPVLIGLGVGIAAAGGAARGLSSLLFGVAPTDLVTFGSAALLLAAVALAACYLPARRVSRVDPMEALRYE